MEERKKQIKIGIILNYVNMILGNLIPIFYTPIMLSLLGQSEYGLYKLSSSVTSYLSLVSMGLGSAITRYLIKAREEEGKEAEKRMLGLFNVIFNIIAVVALIAGVALTVNLHRWYGDSLSIQEVKRMKLLVLMMVINMSLSFSQSPYLSIVTAHEKFLFYQCMNILSTCVTPILNIVALYAGFASVGMTVVSLAVSIVTRFVYQVYVRRSMGMKPCYKGMPTNMLGDIVKFSFWIFVSNVVGQLYNATDTVMIGMVPALATTGVAVYNVGITLSSMIGNISTGISSLMTPMANRMVFQGADGEELTTLAIKVGRIQGFIAMLLISGFISFGRPFVYLYAGEDYVESYWVAICIAVPAVIHLVQSVCLSILTAENKHRFRSLMYLFIAALNVIGTWFLMKRWGVVGAAAMSGIATVIGQGFIMNWYYHKCTNLNMKRFWKEVLPVFPIPVIMIACMLVVNHFVDFYSLSMLLLGIMVFTFVFIVLIWNLSLNKFEKRTVLELLQKRKMKE